MNAGNLNFNSGAAYTFDLICVTDAPEFVHVMDGLGSEPDLFISPLGEDVAFGAFSLTMTTDLSALSTTAAVHTGQGAAPTTTGFESLGNGEHRVQLDRPVEPGHWLRLTLTTTGADGSGTFDVWLGHLPLDVNQDGLTNIRDATAFGEEFNGRRDPRLVDTNGDADVDVRDATAFGNNWFGRAPATRQWHSTSLPVKP